MFHSFGFWAIDGEDSMTVGAGGSFGAAYNCDPGVRGYSVHCRCVFDYLEARLNKQKGR